MRRILLVGLVLAAALKGSAQTGSFWTKLDGPYGGTANDLAYHPNGNIYAGTNQGLFVSNDGFNWNGVDLGTDSYDYVYDIEMDQFNNIYVLLYRSIYRSIDGGSTWQQMSLPTIPSGFSMEFFNMAVGYINPNFVWYVGGYSYEYSTSLYTYKVYRSTDNGTNWSQSFATTTTSNWYWRAMSLDVNPVNLHAFLGTPFNGVFRSIDNGSNWVAINSGIPSPGSQPINCVQANTGGTVLAIVPASGLYSWNGTTWTQNTAISGYKAAATFHSYDLLVPFGSTGFYIVDYSQGNIEYTSNNGTGWSLVPDPNIGVTGLVPKGSTAQLMLAGYNELRFTINTGSTWTSSFNGLEALYANDLTIPDVAGRILASTSTGLKLSTDDGSSWSTPTASQSPDLLKLSSGVILSYSGRSTDNGSTWTGSPPYLYEMATGDNTIVYGISYNSGWKFQRSIDAGINWAQLTVTGLPASYEIYPYEKGVLGVNSGNEVYFTLYNQSTTKYELWKFPNSTLVASQVTISGANEIRYVRIAFGTYYAVGSNSSGSTKLWTSANGTTWTEKDIPVYSRFYVPSSGIIFTGHFDNFHYSKDQGTTWTRIDIDPDVCCLDGLEMRSDGYVYVLMDKKGTYRSSSPILPPSTAAVLQIPGYTSTQVDLRWTYTPGAVPPGEFVIERSTDGGANFTEAFTYPYYVGQTVYYEIDYGSQATTAYVYRVGARNAGGTIYSNSVNVTTLAECTSTIPSNRSWTATGGYSTNSQVVIQLTGDAAYGDYYVSDITSQATPYSGYFNEECNATKIYYWTGFYPNGNGTWNGSNVLVLRYTDGVTPRTVTYTLNAVDPIPPIPSSPELFVANGSTIALRFYGNYWETSFDIQRSTVLGGPYTTVANVPWTQDGYNNGFTHFDQIASPLIGTTYYYRVIAKNSSGSSAPSGESSIVLTNPPFDAMQNALWNIGYTAWGAYYGDFDEDGRDDLLVPYNYSVNSPQVFKNTNGTSFTSMYQALNVNPGTDPGYFRGSVVADLNNDSNLDFFSLDAYSGGKSWYALGNGAGTFTTVSSGTIVDVKNFANMSAADYDNDGRLDFYFTGSYDDISGSYLNSLYRNTGSNNFSVASAAGVTGINSFSRSSAWSDYDNDNDQDLFVGYYDDGSGTIPNKLFVNDGDGTFTELTGSVLDTDLSRSSSRTASWGDFNNDSYLDLFVGNSGLDDWLYQNDGFGGFTKVVSPAFTTALSHGTYSSAWGDLDNDGRLDLVLLRNTGIAIIHNDGGGVFTPYATLPTELYAQSRFSAGVALSDVNNDGLLDITIVEYYGYPSGVFLNDGTWYPSATTNKWFKVRLHGTASNNSAIGALVEVKRASYYAYRELASPTGTYAQSGLTQHFGLGTANILDEVKVYWPSGLTSTLTNQAVNQTIDIYEDGTAPTIVHTEGNRNNGTNYTVSATITDAGGLSDVYVGWKGIREQDVIGSYQFDTMTPGTGNNWTAQITASDYDEIGIEYYIGATDIAGNFDEVGPFFSRTHYPGASDIDLPGLRSGGTVQSWKIFGIPYDLANKSAEAVFDELGPYDKNIWRMVTYKDQTSWSELKAGFTGLDRGKGYFVNMVNSTPVKFGDATTPDNDLNNEFRISVRSGFNMISNPYPFSLDWDDVLCYNGVSSGMDLKTYNGGYIPATSLGPFDGGLFQSGSGSTLDFPLTLVGTGCRIERITASDLGQQAWKLYLHLRNSVVQYGIGGIGMHPEASIAIDKYDDYAPPRFDDFLEMSFDQSSPNGDAVTLDFAPTSESYIWAFSVDAGTEGATEISWNHLELGDNTIPLYLYDKTAQKVVNMRISGSYPFVMGKSRKFEIHFGKEVVPDRVVLGEAYPNPFGDFATIPFALPDNKTGGYQVAIEVYNSLGVRVRSVGEGRFEAGFHEMSWDGRDDNSETLKPGMYLYRLKVSQNGGTQTVTSRIIKN